MCAALVLMPACGQAADAPVEWIADANGCKAENRSPAPKQSISWRGACRDGFAEGQGRFQSFADGLLVHAYEGGMKRGRFSGPGVRTTRTDQRFEGNFVDGRLEGPGQLTYAGGVTAKGSFVANQLEGPCTFSWPSGDRYEGECKAGRPEGSGQIQFANGDAYAGALVQGLASGQGRYSWANGNSYEGRFMVGQAAGAGEYRFADGGRFSGNFRFGVPWGQGRVQLADGIGFEGGFVMGAPAGAGNFLRPDGPPPQDSPELRSRLQLRYAKAQLLAPAWQGPSVNAICHVRPQPDLPQGKWAGRAVYRAVVVVREGQLTAIEVKTLKKADEDELNQQMLANVERAIRSYQCSGDRVFEQDFVFGPQP